MAHLLVSAAMLLLASPSWGDDQDEAPTCRPLYACTPGTLDCPHGGECSCVPSCPICADCAAFVCLRGQGGGGGDDDPSCRERRDKVARAVDDLVARSSACRDASDCVFIDPSTRCGARCTVPVNRHLDRRVARQVRRLDRRVCDDFGRDGCGRTDEICRPRLATCEEGRCVALGLPVFDPRPIPLPPPDGGAVIELQPVGP